MMQRVSIAILSFALLTFQATARSAPGRSASLEVNATATEVKSKAGTEVKSKTASLVKIEPPLKDVSSDKKFFGPPFPADYPTDERPTVSPSIAWQLKEENKPYPYLQNRHEFDKDFVKDENGDKGDWQAQFDYDAYRRRLAKEEADVRRAREKAEKEARDEDAAGKSASDADKALKDAQKNVDEALGNEDKAGKDDGSGSGSGDGISAEDKEKLNELRKKVADAVENYEKEKKQFEQCKKALDDAKQELDDAKAKLKSYEESTAAHTKLWLEKVESRKKVKQAKHDAAEVKVKAAEEKLHIAVDAKKSAEEIYAKEKADQDFAQKTLQKHTAKVDEAKRRLEESRVHLLKLRGIKIPEPSKSGAFWTSGFTSLLMVLTHMAIQLA